MKTKFIFRVMLLLICLGYANSSFAKKANGIIKIDVNLSGQDYFEDENVKISFSMSSSNLYMRIYNKLDDRIYIEWENARTDGKKVIFGTDSRLSVNLKKEDEAVSANSLSISRCFYCENPMAAIKGSWAMPVYTHGILNIEEGDGFSKFLVPIRLKSGETKDYELYVQVKYVNLSDASEIKEGMKAKDVKKLIGDPNFIKKNNVLKIEEWIYSNNIKLVIDKNIVTRVTKLE